MAYVNQEKKAKIAANLKPILKKYGMKGSLSIHHHSSIVLTLRSGVIDFGNDREQVNTYWINDHYTGVARDFLNEAVAALKSADWYDESNAQVDYFNTAYYVNINVGKWNQPYVLIK